MPADVPSSAPVLPGHPQAQSARDGGPNVLVVGSMRITNPQFLRFAPNTASPRNAAPPTPNAVTPTSRTHSFPPTAPYDRPTHTSARPKKLVSVDPLLLTLYPRLRSAPLGRPSQSKAGVAAESWMRPHVEAGDRILFWTSEAAIAKRTALVSNLSPDDLHSYDEGIAKLLALKTRQTYGAGLMEWIIFCDSRAIPEHLRFPADRHHLLIFLSARAGAIGVSKVNNVLSALAFWHLIHDLPWNFSDDELASKFRRLATSKAPAETFKPPRPPITLAYLVALHNGLDLNNPADAALWATACCAFWGVCRLGECTSPALRDPEPDHRALFGAEVSRLKYTHLPSSPPSSTPDGASFFIPWSKTTGYVGATIILSSWDHISCPIRALINHRRVNSSLPPDATFFSFIDSSPKGWSPMIKAAFMRRCVSIWSASGLENCSGHSFRIGGTTELIERGVSFEWVCLQGRWSSEAWRRYVRSTPRLLQLEIARLRSAASTV